ncbi:MAG: hypothetical protein ACFFB8_01645 [Promethearchaeota archaeon]
MSSHVDDIVLTSNILHHSQYQTFLKNEGLAAEIFVRLLMQSLAELVNMKDQNGNYLKIKEEHMREVLYKNFGDVRGEKVLEKCMENPDFVLNLIKFNDRRLDVFNGDYKNFLIKQYSNAYFAYFNKIKRITFTTILATQNNLDFLSAIYGLTFNLNRIQTKI